MYVNQMVLGVSHLKSSIVGGLHLVITEVLLDLSKVLSVKPGVCLALI